MAHTVSYALLAIALAGGAFAPYQPTLDARAVADAIAIGQNRVESQRVRFHQPYRIPVNRPPVDYVEVVTPFRRVELAAEARARAGDRLFGQREALAVLAEAGDGIDFYVEMTFHPLNTYLGVPPYEVTLVGAGSTGVPIRPLRVERIPRHGARLEGELPVNPFRPTPTVPRGSEPMLGGTIVASFDNRLLNPTGVYDGVLSEAGKELARARLNLGVLR